MRGAGTVLWLGSECLDIRSGGAAGEMLDFTLEFPFQLCVFRFSGIRRHFAEFMFPCSIILSPRCMRANSCGNHLLRASWHSKESKGIKCKQPVGTVWRSTQCPVSLNISKVNLPFSPSLWGK